MPNLTDEQKLLRNVLEPVRLVLYNSDITEDERNRQLIDLLRNPIILSAATKYKESFDNISEDLRSTWIQSWIEDNPLRSRNAIHLLADRLFQRSRHRNRLHATQQSAQHAETLTVRNATRRTAHRLQQRAERRAARQVARQLSRDAAQEIAREFALETARESIQGPSGEIIQGPLRESNQQSSQQTIDQSPQRPTQQSVPETAEETAQTTRQSETAQSSVQETGQATQNQAMPSSNDQQQPDSSSGSSQSSQSSSVRGRRIIRIIRPSERAEILRVQPPERFLPAEEHVIVRRLNQAQQQQRMEEEEGENRVMQRQFQLLPPPIFPPLEREARSLHLLPPRPPPQRRPIEPLHLPNQPLVLGRLDIEILSEIMGVLHDPELANVVKIEQIMAMIRTSPILSDMYRERQRMSLQRRSNHRTG